MSETTNKIDGTSRVSRTFREIALTTRSVLPFPPKSKQESVKRLARVYCTAETRTTMLFVELGV